MLQHPPQIVVHRLDAQAWPAAGVNDPGHSIL
jgi:hypothetical protein